MTNFSSIADKYDTDKNSKGHNYMPYYQKHLPENPASLLEIGVYKGESMRMWREIFPNTVLYGLDLFSEHQPPKDIENVHWIRGSQTNAVILEDIRQNIKPEIVLSDGSHNCRDEWVTFYSLIDSCQLYVLEDAHLAFDPFWRQGLKFENTMLGQMKNKTFPFEFELYIDKIAFIKSL